MIKLMSMLRAIEIRVLVLVLARRKPMMHYCSNRIIIIEASKTNL